MASYAAVPRLVAIHRERDTVCWQTYALIGTIETCRHGRRGPAMPDWLAAEYKAAWCQVVPLPCHDLPRASDETTVRAIISAIAIAIAKGDCRIGEMILRYSGEEPAELINAYQPR